MHIKNPLTKETWLFIALTVLAVWVIFSFVPLTPQVDYDVFFSKEDPSYKSDINISKHFPRNDSQILVSFGGNIYSDSYKKKVKKFGDLLLGFPGVSDVKSIMHGPKSVEHAVKSPFWSRLLISDGGRSSNMIATLSSDVNNSPDLINRV